MNWWQKPAAIFRALFRKDDLDREMSEEMHSPIELQTQENIQAGMKPEEARRAALRQVGWAESIKESCREERGLRWLEKLVQDLSFGMRQLAKNPGFTSIAVLTLALGIGASTAIYSVVNSLLLDPVPGPSPERLVQIAERNYTQGLFREENRKPFFCGVSPPVLEALGPSEHLFSDFAWANSFRLERKTEDFIEEEAGWMVSPNFLSLWKVSPLLGRIFAQDETVPMDELDKPVQGGVIVISFWWWKSLFAGDRGVVGKTIELSGHHFTVIGVMPKYFQFPWGATKFWLAVPPLRLPPGWGMGPNIRVFARLRPGITVAEAEAQLQTVAQQLTKDPEANKVYAREWSQRPGGLGFWVRSARAQVTDGQDNLERTLVGLLAAIGFVLLIVCANLANLILARTETRQQELAIRAAMGAGRVRITRQLLTESLLLACLGGIAGIAVAFASAKLLMILVPEFMPRLKPVQIDGHALGFTLLLAVVTGVAFGCAPAWNAGRASLGEALKQAGTQATAGLGRCCYRSALVTLELTLTLVLLTGAGLMIESVVRLLHVDPGFDPQNLVRIDLQLPWDRYNDQEHLERAAQLRTVVYTQLEERLAALPGVQAAGLGKHGAWPVKLTVLGHAEPDEALLEGCGVEESDVFRAMRIPLLAGRYFDRRDLGKAVGTAIINETMARKCWPGEDALGKKFHPEAWRAAQAYEVVGVVRDIRDSRYDLLPRPTFYRPCAELSLEGQAPFFVLRTKDDPRPLVPAIRRELHAVEPEMRAPGIYVVRQALYDSTQAQRTYLVFLVVFAAAGLFLAALGIYGVLAYSVARRTREIGVRMALGAQRLQVLGLVMKEGARLMIVGVVAGTIAAFWLDRLLKSQLFEVSPSDPLVFSAGVLLLLVVALLACLLPAIRATRVDPMTALHYE
jgi:predicted permease